MRTLPVLLGAALGAAVPASLLAQTPVELIGLGRTTNVIQQDMGTCAIRQCGPTMPVLPPVLPFAGGTAWDATTGGVWITNGTAIMEVDAQCQKLCAMTPIVLPVNAVATGLAVDETQKEMYMTDSAGGITTLALQCPPRPRTRCQVAPLPAGYVIGGIASSDVQDLLFYAVSDFTAGNPPNNTVYVARRTNPCVPICKFPVAGCGGARLGPITGVAFDDCKGVVWVTDGSLTAGERWNPTTCTTTAVACCRLPILGDSYIGLCIRPSQSTAVGQSCTAPACPSCPSMGHTTVGDPALGNPAFGLALVNAPASSSAFLLINAGPCGPGVIFPGWCAPFHVPLPGVIILGPLPTGGATPCGGSTLVSFSVPLNTALCGALLSSQYAVLCLSPIGTGTGVSNCLTHQVSAS